MTSGTKGPFHWGNGTFAIVGANPLSSESETRTATPPLPGLARTIPRNPGARAPGYITSPLPGLRSNPPNASRTLVAGVRGYIVHFDKIRQYNAVSTLHGYRAIEIRSPEEVIDYEDEDV